MINNIVGAYKFVCKKKKKLPADLLTIFFFLESDLDNKLDILCIGFDQIFSSYNVI